MKKRNDLPIYTLDIETDPFKFGRLPQPFAVGFYDGSEFKCFWREAKSPEDVIQKSVAFLGSVKPGLVFIHNGGRFDLFYYLPYLGEQMMILNNRIVVSHIGRHEIRDSFAIMPFALKQYKKDDATCQNPKHKGRKCQTEPYLMFEAKYRDAHRDQIEPYLKGDCQYLHELCSRFVDRFGPRVTIGGTAIAELRKFHKYKTLTDLEDAEIRQNYYYGGRVECFEKGAIESNVSVYDVNSMYPHVMRDFKHPIGQPTLIGNKVTKDTFFVSVTGENLGAFPMRTKQGTVFNGQTGTYHVTIHEFKAALDLGLFKPKRIERTIDFGDKTSFAEFVDTYYREREISKRTGDIVTNLFTKFVLNSAYGKFAQNPENCFDFCIHPVNNILAGTWTPAFVAEGKYVVWKKPSEQGDMLRHNVATAASVTGAARSVLLRALAHATRPLYCDTDSIICESLDGVSIDKAKLGAWKLEETGTRVAIAGRKLYAVFQDDECVKKACKGVKITAEEIERIANGETIEYNRPVPSYKWDGSYSFITRKVRMT